MHSLTGLGRRSPAPPHQASNFQLSIPLTVKVDRVGGKGMGLSDPRYLGLASPAQRRDTRATWNCLVTRGRGEESKTQQVRLPSEYGGGGGR